MASAPKVPTWWDVLAGVVGLGSLAMSIFYAHDGNYPRATYSLVLGLYLTFGRNRS